MVYTLFVDESGSFDSNRGRWIVAGVLVPGDPGEAEKAVRKSLEPALIPHGIDHPRDFHLTEVRKHYGSERARRIADSLFSALGDVRSARVGAVKNRLQRSVGRRQGPIGTFEQTYRLMLLDLIALLEASLPPETHLGELHLVVATRTVDRQAMTTRAQLTDEVLDQITDAVEAGLASRGLLEAASDRRLNHRPASGMWGLAAADAVANVTRHADDGEGAALVAAHADRLGFQIFNGLGDYAERRARIADRDGDPVLALSRWALLRPQNAQGRRERSEEILRLSRALFLHADPHVPRAALESVIERIRVARLDAPDQLFAALEVVEEALTQLHIEQDTPSLARLLFRLRTYLRDWAHRRADAEGNARLGTLQDATRDALLLDPEGFPLVLDDDLRAVNALTQKLALDEALTRARTCADLVERYAAVWDLFRSDGGSERFVRSRTHLRAQMQLARQEALAHPLQPDAGLAEQALRRLDDLPRPDADGDRARLRNDRALAALRCGDLERALSEVEAGLETPDAYDLYYAARVGAEAALSGEQRDRAVALHEAIRRPALTSLWDPVGTPLPLAWRERALLEHLVGRKQDALRALDEAAQRTGLLGEAPIKRWLVAMIKVYRSVMSGNPQSLDRWIGTDEALEVFCRRVESLGQNDIPLAAVRSVSPY